MFARHIPRAVPVLSLVAMLMLGTFTSQAAQAAPNKISTVVSKQTDATTTIRVKGTQKPTFTAYKLDGPPRVVVELSGATLVDRTTWRLNTWAVGEVTAQAARNDVRIVARLARDGRYRVRADGNDVVIRVTSNEVPPPDASMEAAQAKAELAATKRSADRRVRAALETAQQAADRAANEVAAAHKSVATAKASAAKREREAKKQSRDARRIQEQAKKDLAKAKRASAKAEAERQAALATIAKAENRRAEAAQALQEARRLRLLAGKENTAKAKRLRAKAEEAIRKAKAREQRARDKALRAEKQRLQALDAAQAADVRRKAAEKAKRQAQSDESAARSRRDQAVAERRRAESAASAAVARAAELKKEARAAEARARTAQKLRAKEEAARKAAATARAKAEARRARAQAAAESIEASLAALRAAEKTAKSRQRQLALASRKLENLRQTDGSLQQAKQEIRKLRQERDAASSELAKRRQEVKQQREVASGLRAQRDAAEQRVASLEKEANQAKTARARAADKADSQTVRVKRVTYRGGKVRIGLSGTGKSRVVSRQDRRLVLEIENAKIAKRLEKKLDASKLPGAVSAVSAYRNPRKPGTVRVVVDLKHAATSRLTRRGNELEWEFVEKRAAARPAKRSASVPPQEVAAYGSSTPITQQTVSQFRRRKTYRGRPIDIDFKDVDIHNLLRLLADVGGVNIVVPDTVTANITVRLKGVPWDQALEVVLASKGLWYRRVGKLIRIDQRKTLDAEDKAEQERIKAALDSEAPEPEVFSLNYAKAAMMQTQVSSLLSPKGRIQTDERTNAIIINDIAAHRRRIIALLRRLDTPTPQIQVEARIVEARTNYSRAFGIQWGGAAAATQATGNATGLVFPSDITVAGATDDPTASTTGLPAAAVPSNFVVNMPAAIGAGSGAGLGIALGSITGAFNLNLRLSALEDTGSVRVISSPKITTVNAEPAAISSGVSIPISVVSASGAQTQFVPADLSLDVTPTVSQRDCSVLLEVQMTKNTPDFANTGARGDPSILTQQLRTKLLVNDGETAVLGGIYTRNTSLDYNKVPFFSDIPVLGYLFKNRRENDARNETLIFITPKITNRAFLRCE